MKYMADVVSLFRILTVLPVLYFSFADEWRLALAFLVLGWGSDLADGYYARKFGSLRDAHPDFDADGIADSILAFATSFVPVIYVIDHESGAWASLLIWLWIMTVISGVAMVRVMGKPITTKTRLLVAGNMVVMHGLVQIVGTLCWFAFMAFGIVGVAAVIIAMIPVGFKQRRKMSLWLVGRFE
jgi:phosphatidylglycerophosphate synthase